MCSMMFTNVAELRSPVPSPCRDAWFEIRVRCRDLASQESPVGLLDAVSGVVLEIPCVGRKKYGERCFLGRYMEVCSL